MRRPIGFIGVSGSGKTTLVTALVRHFSERGERIAVVKHTDHLVTELDDGGDTRRALDAGAAIAVVADDRDAVRWYAGGEREGPTAYEDPAALVGSIDATRVLVEGWKSFRLWPVILVERTGLEAIRPVSNLAAVVSDVATELPVPRFAPDDLVALADFVDRIAGS